MTEIREQKKEEAHSGVRGDGMDLMGVLSHIFVTYLVSLLISHRRSCARSRCHRE
jgi:hypothetical protein